MNVYTNITALFPENDYCNVLVFDKNQAPTQHVCPQLNNFGLKFDTHSIHLMCESLDADGAFMEQAAVDYFMVEEHVTDYWEDRGHDTANLRREDVLAALFHLAEDSGFDHFASGMTFSAMDEDDDEDDILWVEAQDNE